MNFQLQTRPALPPSLPAALPASEAWSALGETIGIDDISSEMNGLSARFLADHATTRADGTAVRFATGQNVTIEDWNGTNQLALIDTASIPKVLIAPAPAGHADVRLYDVGLAGQRRAIERNQQRLGGRLAVAERARLVAALARRTRTYSRLWVRQMMYNRFDTQIAKWAAHYNTALSPRTPLDPNIVKSICFQESRMGTSGDHLLPPPYDWTGRGNHPIKSRFNIGQAVDSFGPQQWLMMREMAPAIATRHGLDTLESRRVWQGMSRADYAAHSTFFVAVKTFFEVRSRGANALGTRNVDLHLDYEFWIRTAIRWLFHKYTTRGSRSWTSAVRAYNGGGARADRYRDAVMARVGAVGAFRATDMAEPSDAALAEGGPGLSSGAKLTWQNISRIPDSKGVPQVFYVITGAPPSVAKVGHESHAVFELRVGNKNSVWDHLSVQTKVRLLKVKRGREFETAYPDPASKQDWAARKQSSLVDETSRVKAIAFPRAALMRAYDSDYPMARVEVEYHWRELGENRNRYHARTGLDFVLVAPIEFMFSKRKHVGEIKFDDAEKHRRDFWIPVAGVNFSSTIRTPFKVSYNVRSEIAHQATASTTQAQKTSHSQTNTSSSSNTFSATLSGKTSAGTSSSASVKVFEFGVSQMFEIGASLGFSHTSSQSKSVSNAREFSRSVMLSKSYRTAQSISTQASLEISPPRPTGPSTTRSPRANAQTSVGVYLYPIVDYYEVPFVRFGGINRFGQATSRTAGTVLVPYVREWRLIASDA